MKRKQIISMIMLLCLLFLSGCQLAREGADKVAQDDYDRLIGVFITTEYLDLFDMEAYLNDNINSITSGASKHTQTTIPQNAAQAYSRRIYADIKEDGSGDSRDYSFEGLDGILMIMPTVHADNSEDAYITATSDSEVSEISAAVGDHQKLEGTIYASSREHASFYFNPIYQTPGGAIYLTAGQGISGNLSDESAFSQSIKEDYTSSYNGETKASSMEVSVKIQGKQDFVSYDILQMDENDQCIDAKSFTPDHMPDTIQAAPGAEYIIVAGSTATGQTPQKERQIYDITGVDDPEIQVFVPLDHGILAKTSISVTR